MQNSAGDDSSTGSELKAVEEACREASRTAEPLNGLNDLNLSPFYDVIDTFGRRRYFFRKRLRVFQISDSDLGVHKRGIVGAVATVFS